MAIHLAKLQSAKKKDKLVEAIMQSSTCHVGSAFNVILQAKSIKLLSLYATRKVYESICMASAYIHLAKLQSACS